MYEQLEFTLSVKRGPVDAITGERKRWSGWLARVAVDGKRIALNDEWKEYDTAEDALRAAKQRITDAAQEERNDWTELIAVADGGAADA